ncbi:hypothetical protein [Micromonospora sp. HM5-17]|uniref:hypothetical protein n=1 Tax=Micromonospora sp. HM5-17 TaxID=2487710 RepID=UPI000F48F341|nr:hypothetical protein [Micromonospora sp. HM5-17]ROT31447.1 hypothetical protein EF879_17200 [Micromonospora sp. HM5-17]
MLIDCDTCTARGAACAGCVVSALLDRPSPVATLTPDEQYAIEVFARAGFDVEVLPTPPPPPVRLATRRRRRRVA